MKRSLDDTFKPKRKLINKAINLNFLNHLNNNITTFSGPSEALHTSTSGGGTDFFLILGAQQKDRQEAIPSSPGSLRFARDDGVLCKNKELTVITSPARSFSLS